MSASSGSHEEIFEWDGGDTASGHRQQLTSIPAQSVEDGGPAGLSTAPLAPREAFHLFHAAASVSIASYDERMKGIESPVERFNRLALELSDLRDQLDGLTLARAAQEGSLWALLARETARLSEESRTLARHPALTDPEQTATATATATSSATTPPHGLDTLTERLTTMTPAAPASRASAATSPTTSLSLAPLESRVAALEALLGTRDNTALTTSAIIAGTGSLGNPATTSIISIRAALAACEDRLARLEPTTLDTLRTKAKLLRSELELLSGKGSTGTGVGVEVKALDAAKKVESLTQSVAAVEAVAEDLPALVARLKTLESVHWSASTASQRLTLLEQDITNLRHDTTNNAAVLKELKDALKNGLDTFKANVIAIEKRLAPAN